MDLKVGLRKYIFIYHLKEAPSPKRGEVTVKNVQENLYNFLCCFRPGPCSRALNVLKGPVSKDFY